MILVTNPKNCCGCTACKSVCKQNAITMQPDSLGFLYPIIDNAKCTNCGLCEKVCSFNENYNTTQNFKEPLAFGARHKNMSEIMNSRSGAVFVALSDYILENKGVIYGAGYDSQFNVIHKRASNKEERDEFRGSKYVQSDLSDVFVKIKNDLKNGLTVLFSGTPCQTAGLSSYVGKKLQKNLILVDIICHGVPSPFIWRDYKDMLEKKHNSKIVDVDFRNKKIYGWREHKDTIKFSNNEIENESWFSTFFYKALYFRESCGNCYFCNLARPSDITLGDFWGIEKQNKTFNSDNKGVSLLLINTEKGKDIFECIKEQLFLIETTPSVYTELNPNLRKPSWIHPKRNKFVNDYVTKGFNYIYKHDYDKVSFVRAQLRKIKKVIKSAINYENRYYNLP